jgi:type IV secretory pathway VirJ component
MMTREQDRWKVAVDLNQVLDRPATADLRTHDAVAALISFKQGFDAMEEIPTELMPYYKQTMKTIGLLGKAAEEAYQLRMMVRRMPR